MVTAETIRGMHGTNRPCRHQRRRPRGHPRLLRVALRVGVRGVHARVLPLELGGSGDRRDPAAARPARRCATNAPEVTIEVDDVDARGRRRRARSAARVVMPKATIPGVGDLAFFTDPSGNLVGAIRYDQLQVRSSGQTILSTRVKAPRSSRSGVSHAVWRQGSSTTPSLAARRARAGELAVVGVALAGAGRGPSGRRRVEDASLERRRSWSTSSAGRTCVPRPTSSSERASLTSLRRCIRCRRVTERRRTRGGSACPCRAAPRSRWRPARRRRRGPGRWRASARARPACRRRTRCRRRRARAGRCRCGPSRSRGSRRARPGSRSRRATSPCRGR